MTENFDTAREAIQRVTFVDVHTVTADYKKNWDNAISAEELAGAEIIEELLNSGKLSKEALEDAVTTVIGNNDPKYFEVEAAENPR